MSTKRSIIPKGRRRFAKPASIDPDFHNFVVSKILARQQSKKKNKKLTKSRPCSRSLNRVDNKTCGEIRAEGGIGLLGILGRLVPFQEPWYDAKLNIGFQGFEMPSYYGERTRGMESRISPIEGKEDIVRKLEIKAQRAKCTHKRNGPRQPICAPAFNNAYRNGNGRSQLSGMSNRSLKRGK